MNTWPMKKERKCGYSVVQVLNIQSECIWSVESQKGITLFSDILLSTRRVLSLYKVYGDSTLLVLNGHIYEQR